jgi:DNA-binding NtrC family response regulator
MERQVSGVSASWKADGAMASRSGGVDCVFLSCFDHSVLFLASMLGQGGIRLHRAHTLEVADFLLLATRGTVLVLDTTFLDGSWEDALAMTAQAHPLVATLICADLVDREFIASAQERGAFDVLWRPIELERLRPSIWTAHEVTVERRLWLAEREHECRSNQHSVSGFRLETVK